MTSMDVYAYLITLSIVVVTFFVCWTLYYCIRILKKIYQLIDTIDDSLARWSHGWESLVERVTTMRDSLQLVIKGIQTASGAYNQYKKKSSKKHSDEREDTSGV